MSLNREEIDALREAYLAGKILYSASYWTYGDLA